MTRPHRLDQAGLVLLLVILLAGTGLMACGGGSSQTSSGDATSPAGDASPTSAAAVRLRSFLRDQQHAIDMTATANTLERKASSAMRTASLQSDLDAFDTARDLYGQAARAYGSAAAFMRSVDAPKGLESFGDLAAAQSAYANALGEAWTSGATGSPKQIADGLDAAWMHYKAVLRRYNAALIRVSAESGVTPSPWLLVPALGQPVP